MRALTDANGLLQGVMEAMFGGKEGYGFVAGISLMPSVPEEMGAAALARLYMSPFLCRPNAQRYRMERADTAVKG